MNAKQAAMVGICLLTTVAVPQDDDAALRYVTDLSTAVQTATTEKKGVMLYTGTAHHLRGSTPRAYFLNYISGANPSLQKLLERWIVCEQFVLQPTLNSSGKPNPAYQTRMAAFLQPLLEKYSVPVLTPAVTLLDSSGKKLAGPFGEASVRSLVRHIEPPPVLSAAEAGKGKTFALFSGEDIDSVARVQQLPVQIVPFLTKTDYSILGAEHQFEVKDIRYERFDDQGRFHVVQIFASGRLTPPPDPRQHAVMLVDGRFYKGTWDRFLPADPLIKGVGALQMKPGDDWIMIRVDNKPDLDVVTQTLNAFKAIDR